ncbi:hypothetical protein EW145_g4126 [Phellinidium pouzarii]|uniref:Alpha/beta hydrolase fold-3 domain-containing protein n=1 Tax=Phellinidium pouzarii TaxID=167371 RepID=A0A4S4L6I0_9AGAM|nr:hypothetical protein EW145_g4126 [Phellinidium pouzarii]
MSTIVPPFDKFVPFSVSTQTYKTVDGHSILADVIIPRKLLDEGPESPKRKTKRPVIVRYHGGWLIGGHRDWLPWWPRWILDIALRQDAIIVTADYRLLPEATGEDILDDMHDFWKWLGSDFSSTVQNKHLGLQPDLDRVLLVGESSGGYLALQNALSFFKSRDQAIGSGPTIRALVVQYPAISLRTSTCTMSFHKGIFGQPQHPKSLIDEHLTAIAAERARTGRQPILSRVELLTPELVFTPRAHLAIAIQQHGRYVDILGPERDSSPGKRRLHPEDRIADGAVLPPILYVQGRDDTVTPVEGADMFIEHLRKYRAIDGLAEGRAESEVLMYCRVPGEHMFDADNKLSDDADGWMKSAAVFMEKHWLE